MKVFPTLIYIKKIIHILYTYIFFPIIDLKKLSYFLTFSSVRPFKLYFSVAWFSLYAAYGCYWHIKKRGNKPVPPYLLCQVLIPFITFFIIFHVSFYNRCIPECLAPEHISVFILLRYSFLNH